MTARARFLLFAAGLAILAALVSRPAHAETHEVLTFDFAFAPAHITIAPGDTVRWVWVNGFHTASSVNAGCGPNGVFHGAVDSFNPVYEWTAPADAPPSVISYVCLPHCPMGMNGTITIKQQPDNPADLNDDGVVDVFDLLILLASWGPCQDAECPADFNGDMTVDVFDLLFLLASWG
jgi:plastocyanin